MDVHVLVHAMLVLRSTVHAWILRDQPLTAGSQDLF